MDKKITDLTGTFKLCNGVDMPYLGLGTHYCLFLASFRN